MPLPHDYVLTPEDRDRLVEYLINHGDIPLEAALTNLDIPFDDGSLERVCAEDLEGVTRCLKCDCWILDDNIVEDENGEETGCVMCCNDDNEAGDDEDVVEITPGDPAVFATVYCSDLCLTTKEQRAFLKYALSYLQEALSMEGWEIRLLKKGAPANGLMAEPVVARGGGDPCGFDFETYVNEILGEARDGWLQERQ
jgi:hypothetical protein